MKKALWGLGIAIVGLGLFGLGWISHGEVGKALTAPSAAPPIASMAPSNPGANPPSQAAPARFISQSDFQQLRAARNAVMQANPDLAVEYKEIINEMQAQQTKLDAAMIKADPKVAAIIAKLVELRQRNASPAPAPGNHP